MARWEYVSRQTDKTCEICRDFHGYEFDEEEILAIFPKTREVARKRGLDPTQPIHPQIHDKCQCFLEPRFEETEPKPIPRREIARLVEKYKDQPAPWASPYAIAKEKFGLNTAGYLVLKLLGRRFTPTQIPTITGFRPATVQAIIEGLIKKKLVERKTLIPTPEYYAAMPKITLPKVKKL